MMKQRLHALDVLRGLTVAFMILVNTPGTWSHVYAPLCHSPWNGLTLADLVFPAFMFMMGVSMHISLRKYDFRLQKALAWKILRRVIVLFCLGLFIYGLSGFLATLNNQYGEAGCWQVAFASLADIRILGVLQRLALCYGVAALLVTAVRHRMLPYVIGGILLSYYVVLVVGHGFSRGPENWLAQVDQWLLGLSHMYNDHGIDPEGVLSTWPSVAHVLIGFCFGKICLERSGLEHRLNRIFLYASLCLLVGFLLQDLCPLNKKVWSPTFVLVTCGFTALLLAILLWYMDMQGMLRHTLCFDVFGMNPLFCYVLSEVLIILTDYFPLHGHSVHQSAYETLAFLCGDNAFTSLLYALLSVCVVGVMGYILYRKKIYIKI